MTKRIFSVLLLVVVLLTSFSAFAADSADAKEHISLKEEYAKVIEDYDAEEHKIYVTNVKFDADNDVINFDIVNNYDKKYAVYFLMECDENSYFGVKDLRIIGINDNELVLEPKSRKTFTEKLVSDDYEDGIGINFILGYQNAEVYTMHDAQSDDSDAKYVYYEDVMGKNSKQTSGDAVVNFLKQTGFWKIIETINWQSLVMILIACVLIYLAIVKKFEPLLLLPIAFGMLLTNLLGADMYHEEIFKGGHIDWHTLSGHGEIAPGLVDYLYLGVKLGIYPCLIFVGVGAMTDFGPLIANPKSLILGAAAQIGIFATFIGACLLGFTQPQAGSIGIIGGADGPTAIFLTSKLAPELLGPIAVAAYSYMALVPVIQPPIMKALTTKEERQIVMKELRPVSKTQKIVFPIVTTVFVALLVPSAAPLVGCLMLGNLLKESGVCERLSKTVQNELMNIVTIFLGISVGATATASTFLTWETIKIIVMGVVAFGVATACGVLIAKLMNLFLKNKINPLIGSAGVSAVPMAARVSQTVGQKENPSNFLLMHAMGPNVAGVIGSAIAAGALLAMLG